jgi:hypothetical protein
MDKSNTLLTDEEIDKLCAEIEEQWLFLLMTRSVFHANFYLNQHKDYESPEFYSQYGFKFKISIPEVLNENWAVASKGVAVWLNQNYIIRLYGILDSRKLFRFKDRPEAEILKLIHLQRQNVGAHSSGKRVKRRDLLKANKLVNQLCGRNIPIEETNHIILSVDSVLKPIKDQCIGLLKQRINDIIKISGKTHTGIQHA